MKLAIVIPTYYRPDNRTYSFLTRALRSVFSQTYKDFQVYLIGDDYSNKGQFKKIAHQFKVKFINLDQSVERELYQFGTYTLFCAGGLTPILKGIEMALADGYQYICHLDHDDWWEPMHLEYINAVIENYDPLFVCTVSTYYGNILPGVKILNDVQPYITAPGCCALSSSCIKYSVTKLRFRDVYKETGRTYPADADLWERMKDQGRGYLITAITCHHDSEAYSLNMK